MIGKTLAQYKMIEVLGRGGMGSVYKALDTQLDRLVVLKLLSRNLLTNENARSRFLREARLASALDHPNICTIYEIQETEGFYYIAMQFIEGQTLKKTINQKPLMMSMFFSIAFQIGDAIATAHDRGIIHRDVKPQNIMITPRGQVKVLDFGLAKNLNREASSSTKDLTEHGKTLGTPSYMSPEQARAERVDRRADIFSFGSVLYEMITGTKPFEAKNTADILYAVCNQQTKRIVHFNSKAPSELQEIIDKAMAKEPIDRYQSVQALLADLKSIASASSAYSSNTNTIGNSFTRVENMVIGWVSNLLPKSLQPKGTISNSTLGTSKNTSEEKTLQREELLSDDFPIIPGQHKTLAVLPFRNLSNNVETKWRLALLETFITALAKFRSLTIRPPSYVTKYIDQDINPIAVGRELGVDAILLGNFLKTCNKLRLTIQIISIVNGNILWAGKIDVVDTDVINLQDVICERTIFELSSKPKPNSTYNLLKDESEEIRIEAIATLKFSSDPYAIDILLESLGDSSPRVQASAALALTRFGRSAIPKLILKIEEAMAANHSSTARFAIQAVGKIGSAEGLPTLLEALSYSDSFVAGEAALALGRLKDLRAQPELIEALLNPDANIRFTATQALGELASSESLNALKSRLRTDEDEGVRAKAIWAISCIRRKHPEAYLQATTPLDSATFEKVTLELS